MPHFRSCFTREGNRQNLVRPFDTDQQGQKTLNQQFGFPRPRRRLNNTGLGDVDGSSALGSIRNHETSSLLAPASLIRQSPGRSQY